MTVTNNKLCRFCERENNLKYSLLANKIKHINTIFKGRNSHIKELVFCFRETNKIREGRLSAFYTPVN